jgi:hypothetical protein
MTKKYHYLLNTCKCAHSEEYNICFHNDMIVKKKIDIDFKIKHILLLNIITIDID